MLAAPRAHGQPVEAPASAHQQRVEHAARAATEMLTEWLGPPPGPISAGSIPHRWLLLERDRSLERTVIAGIARQFWARTSAATPFEEALAVYTGTRAIHHLLEGSNFEVVRFFGGFVPYPLRSVLLSPPVADPRPRVWQFAELPATGGVARMVRSLQTLERYAGWPAMAQALAAVRSGGAIDAQSFAATITAIRGADLSMLIHELLREDAVFDYAIENVSSAPVGDGLVESSLSLLRTGSGVFVVGDAQDREPNMPILVRFEDGTELRDWFDGAAPSTTLVYTARSGVAYAAIDPELMLLLDVNRSNNTFAATAPVRPLGVRLALHWMSWLQQTMLAYTALA
jgi:hypothetical protein